MKPFFSAAIFRRFAHQLKTNQSLINALCPPERQGEYEVNLQLNHHGKWTLAAEDEMYQLVVVREANDLLLLTVLLPSLIPEELVDDPFRSTTVGAHLVSTFSNEAEGGVYVDPTGMPYVTAIVPLTYCQLNSRSVLRILDRLQQDLDEQISKGVSAHAQAVGDSEALESEMYLADLIEIDPFEDEESES